MPLVSYQEATRLVLGGCRSLESQTLPVEEAVGRFLAQPLVALHDSPRFDCSAVDGYALGPNPSGDLLRLVGRAEAGEPYDGRVGEGECVRILTGAVVPPDIGAIAMQEDCQIHGERLTVGRPVRKDDNIRRQGEEYRAGETLLHPGTLVTPIIAGLAVAQGRTTLRLGGAPSVVILATGNELRSPGEELGPGAVYASNVTTFVAAVRTLGLPVQARVIHDDPVLIQSALEEAFETSDLVVTTGGVSVGDRDHVRDCAHSIGVEEVFWRVAMKPGKPLYFGVRRDKPLIGLPGNPVAAVVAFHLFVRPALLRLMGAAEPGIETFPVRLGKAMRKRGGRTEFVRIFLQIEERGLVAHPVAGQGSHMIGGLASAHALLHLAEEQESFEEGEFVPASLFRWSLL